jgi:hypothetical protein
MYYSVLGIQIVVEIVNRQLAVEDMDVYSVLIWGNALKDLSSNEGIIMAF